LKCRIEFRSKGNGDELSLPKLQNAKGKGA